MLGRSTPKKDRIVTRAEAVVDTTPVEGNLMKVKTPKFISLVGSPANGVGIKVMRSDDGETKMSNTPLVRRTRRADNSPVLRLSFPKDTDEATVTDTLTEFGLTGYKVENIDGIYTATRADLKSISKEGTMMIVLREDGLTATVKRQDAVSGPAEKANVAMAALEFDASKFALEDVQRWVAEKCVDGTIQEPQNSDIGYVVRRSEVKENEEVRRMVLEDGVTAVIVRADSADIPSGFVAVVSEAAYGSWGWGQLDFAAAMGDTAFSEAMRDAIYLLEDVLRNIVIYSALPLDVRKELANRALAQFGDYIGTVMDSLPRQLLVAVVRSAANPQQEKDMTKETSGTNTPAAPAVAAAKEEVLTRADIAQMLAENNAQLLKALAPAPTAEEVARAEAAKPVTRGDISALVAPAVAEAVKPLMEQIEKLSGTTTVRSAPSADNVSKDDKNAVADDKTKDVFRGSLGLPRAASK